MEPSTNSLPRHIGFILDGNRRFAKRIMLKPWKGHEWGYEKTREVLQWCRELHIPEVTLYAFSIENFDRPKEEFEYLMQLFQKAYTNFKTDPQFASVKINFIGRLSMFPKDVQDAMYNLMDATKGNTPYVVNIAMAYGGRAEIIDATKKIAEKIKEGKLDVQQINEEVFAKNLYLNSDPDLIIRTSGEQRLSGFLLYQGSYAEISFVDKLWPEFAKEDLIACINDYAQRERRFGK